MQNNFADNLPRTNERKTKFENQLYKCKTIFADHSPRTKKKTKLSAKQKTTQENQLFGQNNFADHLPRTKKKRKYVIFYLVFLFPLVYFFLQEIEVIVQAIFYQFTSKLKKKGKKGAKTLGKMFSRLQRHLAFERFCANFFHKIILTPAQKVDPYFFSILPIGN